MIETRLVGSRRIAAGVPETGSRFEQGRIDARLLHPHLESLVDHLWFVAGGADMVDIDWAPLVVEFDLS